MSIWMSKPDRALGEKLLEERSKLKNPIDRIAFDNRFVNGVPAGLFVLAVERERREERERFAVYEAMCAEDGVPALSFSSWRESIRDEN